MDVNLLGLNVTTSNIHAQLIATTGAVTSWDANADNPVNAIAVSAGTVYLGGYFYKLHESPHSDIAGVSEAVLHIILSHHGMLEHGSPVVPCTREATLVHMIDNLGGRLGSFDRIEKSLPGGERWSGFDRALAGPAYFATRGLGEAA